MNDIHGLKPFMYFAPSWKVLLVAGLLILAAGALAYFLMRPRKPVAMVARPVATTLKAPVSVRAQLDRLKASGLIERDRVREFHAELSALMRNFLGARYDLPGRRLTTTEILAALTRQAIDPEAYRLIAGFLPACDLAKFADTRPTRADMSALLATAYQLVGLIGDTETPAEEADEIYV